uniref:Uncharacterized protein AlNc14C53G4119 n=1 Tax=Albugo laibachii Nc14 TaxID=890382 RepID=F0WBS8_9STRA|nr:conserved hypothetical protein [Albugo laibachii Nc14]CCA20562.1 conserved hypothetical protein [Albugo laibachii Nc14]|eukprot:CCA20562.1 conserved hypothetical protein [Albugo laibachii Nc14]
MNLETDATEYLRRFWATRAAVFMRWFLSLPSKGQEIVLTNASPDLPYTLNETGRPAAQLLAPELCLSTLLQDNGKAFIKLIHARASKRDDCARGDLDYLLGLRKQGIMPTFSGKTLDQYLLAFVDPVDPEMKIQAVSHTASQKVIEEKKRLIDAKSLIEADVWLTLQMRQQVIVTFLTHITSAFEALHRDHLVTGIVNKPQIGCRYCGSSILESENSQSPDKNLLRCECLAAFYCSEKHKSEDWIHHQGACHQVCLQRSKEELIESRDDTKPR